MSNENVTYAFWSAKNSFEKKTRSKSTVRNQNLKSVEENVFNEIISLNFLTKNVNFFDMAKVKILFSKIKYFKPKND